MSGSQIERDGIKDGIPAADSGSKNREHNWRPAAEGLYDPALEKDSCGVGFIANIKGKKSHQIVQDAINIPAISNIAALSAPIRAQATARASSCRFRTPSSHARRRKPASPFPRPASTPSARYSCPARNRGAR